MRIAMLGLKGLPGAFGGVERHVEELGAALAARGHEVTAYVRRFYTPREIDVRGVHTKLLPTIHTKHLDATVHTFLGAFHAGLGPYDVVHFHAIGPAGFGVITRLLGKPVVATVNGGPNEYVWHAVNGLKIYPHPNSVGWGLGTLFTNFEWARWMGRNGRMAVEAAVTWDRIADRVLDVYYH